jgi:hypothetical protein
LDQRIEDSMSVRWSAKASSMRPLRTAS